MPKGKITIGYADDTLSVAESDTANKVQNRVNATLDAILWHIRCLDLSLAIEKTQTSMFKRQYDVVSYHSEGGSDLTDIVPQVLGYFVQVQEDNLRPPLACCPR